MKAILRASTGSGCRTRSRSRTRSPRHHAALKHVTYTRRDLYTIAQLTTSFKVDGHRADIVILKTAHAHAAWQGRLAIGEQDILLAAELALPHRLKRQPFEEAALDAGQTRRPVEEGPR